MTGLHTSENCEKITQKLQSHIYNEMTLVIHFYDASLLVYLGLTCTHLDFHVMQSSLERMLKVILLMISV